MIVQVVSGPTRSARPRRGALVRLLVAIAGALLLVVGLPGGAFAGGLDPLPNAIEPPSRAHDASAYTYTDTCDGAPHGVQVHTGAVAPASCSGATEVIYEAAASVPRASSGASRLCVAANSADELTTVGRWMGDDELAQMQNTGPVVETGSDGRTFVVNPANPAAYPAGTGNFVQFRVPASSLKPAGKPEWNVIPGPSVTTTRWGPAPAEMPPATCIVVVCVR